MSAKTKFLLIQGLLALLFVFPVNSQSVNEWRGSGRTGIYSETSLVKSWPAAGPSLLWESMEAGTGYSSVTVTDDAVYITGRKGDHDYLTAYTQDGKLKWSTQYGKASDSNYPDSRSTATYYNGKLYLVSGSGDMVCIGTDGKILWSVNYFQKYNASAPRFGISESPVVVDNKVIGTPGGNVAAAVALNASDGKVVWTTPPVNEGTQYVNPLVIESGGKKIVVTVTTGSILGINVADGKLLWKVNYEGLNAQQGGRRNHTNTPIYRDGFLLVANGYSQVAVKLKINPDGSPPTIVWKNTDLTPHVGGVVLLGDLIFSSTHDNNSMGKWICVDWNTGKTLWINDWNNKGSVISADGMLYIYEERMGNVGLVKPGKEKLDVVSQFRITKGTGPYWAHPVINKGRLFIRHGEYLGVFNLKSR
ncbi:MAG: PQQ-binding-like beta-propeller repeat protein [Bacteroidales bacterium]|nr:PQQ-binding-like beta-propeller repeat protein [Bacteroidales bacterium]